MHVPIDYSTHYQAILDSQAALSKSTLMRACHAGKHSVPFLWLSLVWPGRDANPQHIVWEVDTLTNKPTRRGMIERRLYFHYLTFTLLHFLSQDKAAVRAAAFTLFGNLSRFGDGPSKTPFLEQIHTNLVSLLLHLNDPEDEVRKVRTHWCSCSGSMHLYCQYIGGHTQMNIVPVSSRVQIRAVWVLICHQLTV